MSRKYYDRLLTSNGVTATPFQSKFGSKILRQMGWTEGKGLGKEEDGKTEPFQAKRREENAGIGDTNPHKKGFNWNNPFWDTMYDEAAKDLQIIVNEDAMEDSGRSSEIEEPDTADLSELSEEQLSEDVEVMRKNKKSKKSRHIPRVRHTIRKHKSHKSKYRENKSRTDRNSK